MAEVVLQEKVQMQIMLTKRIELITHLAHIEQLLLQILKN
jgi:hypothetical protein